MLAIVLHMLQGTPYIYQGEEIGMTDPHYTSIQKYRDVESLNAYAHLKEQGVPEEEILTILSQKSRDNSRTLYNGIKMKMQDLHLVRHG